LYPGEELVRRLVAELIGTFLLVFCGTGAIIASLESGDGIGPFAYIFGFGFTLIFIVYAIGHISGAHVNPAVTLGLALSGKFSMAEVPYYWGSQVVGGLLASLTLRLIYGNESRLGITQMNPEFSVINGFVLEVILTAILVFVVHAAATDKRAPSAATGLAIGGALLVIQVVGGPISGGSVNPARSLAPALVSGTFDDLWIYLIAPFIGAVIGALGYEFIRGQSGTGLAAAQGTTTEPHRGQQRFGRGDRPERGERQARPERGERMPQARSERPERAERTERPERAPRRREEWGEPVERRSERQERQQRPERAPRAVERPVERPVEHVEEFDEFDEDEFGDPLPPSPPSTPRNAR
jgi:MIP family channel proteins